MPVNQDAPDYTQHAPHAHRITSDEEAISIAHEIVAFLQTGASERDLSGFVPPEVVNTYSNSGLWGITVPRRFGGAEVSAATLAAVQAYLLSCRASARVWQHRRPALLIRLHAHP